MTDKASGRGTLAGREGRGIALLLLAVLCFSLLDATSKTLGREYPVLQVSWGRYFFHLLIFTPLTWWRFGGAMAHTRRLGLHVLRAALLVAVTVLFITALVYVPLADATALSFITPLLVTVLSVLLFRERIGRHRWLAALIGFAGVVVIIRPGAGVAHWASFLILAMAVCYACYQLATRSLNRTELPATTLFYTAVVGTTLTTLPLPFVWQWPTPSGWLLMVLLGFLGGAGHFVLIVALRFASPAMVAPFMYMQLVYATGLGWLLFDQIPDGWTAVGAVLIAGAGLWTWWRERRRPPA